MHFKKIVLLVFFVGIFGALLFWSHFSPDTKEVPPETLTPPIAEPALSVEVPEETKKNEVSVPEYPKQVLLPVPFTPQAPTGNWDQLHEEACEEASVLMANAYFQGDTRTTLPPQEVEKEIKKLTTWQQKNFGYSLSIDSVETKKMIEAVYGLHAELIYDFSENDIKTALVEKKIVLVPVNGRRLANPYFQSPGPLYHMLLIKGYDEKSFILNEAGTKRGLNYHYTYQTIENAAGDYDHEKKEIDPAKPVLIIVSK